MKLAAVAIAASAASFVVAGFALKSVRSEPGRRPVEEPATPLVRPTGAGTADPVRVPETRPLPDPRVEQLAARLDVIEERLASIEKSRRTPTTLPTRQPVDPKELEVVILDRAKSPAERASALKKLRSGAPQARTLEIARSMVDLLRTCDDATVRAEICRQLFGVEYPEVGEEMLARLRTDADEATREEAAESLEPFGEEPGVVQALEVAREHDASEKVREQAARTLAEIKDR